MVAENDKYYFDLLMEKCSLSIEIVKKLKDNETLTHNELSKSLNKSKQNLSNTIRKIEPFGILLIRRIGKNVYYSLNFKGYQFYDYFSQDAVVHLIEEREADSIYVPDGARVQGGDK